MNLTEPQLFAFGAFVVAPIVALILTALTRRNRP